jgi:hypothetical protein
VSFARSIYHPDQLWIESIAQSPLFWWEVRVLELKHETITSLHVCYVLLAVCGVLGKLPPFTGKLAFPIAVPLRFILPPLIATPIAFVSPMVNSFVSALGNRAFTAKLTLA